MGEITSTMAVVLGALMRLGIPVTLTVFLIVFLRWMDARWQLEANQQDMQLLLAPNQGCWNVNNCSADKRAKCAAYQHPDQPCWQVFRDKEGRLQSNCLGCTMFKNAPLPVAS